MDSINVYQKFAKFYDGYVKDFTADLPLYQHFCGSPLRILEIGCGSGRILQSLAQGRSQDGHPALGVDISDEMLDIARCKLKAYLSSGQIRLENFNFLHGYLPERFDRVLITFYTINYLLLESDCISLFHNIRQSMEPGGIILIDLFFPKPLQKPETAGIWYETEIQTDGGIIKLRDKRSMDGSVEERVQEYIGANLHQNIVTQRRYYSKQDILKMLEERGFANIEFTDGYDYHKFHRLPDSETVTSSFVVNAQRKPD